MYHQRPKEPAEPKYLKPVPNKLKEILRDRKILKLYPNSYASVAAAANVSKNTVIYLARGDYFPKLDSAYSIARALGVTVYDIWRESELREYLNELVDTRAEIAIAELRRAELDEG
jgi:DNA-binding XRE family transcriptional regulator